MSSKTCRCCLKLRLCRVQVCLQWQKAGVRTSPDGLHRTSRTCRCRARRTTASFHGTRTQGGRNCRVAQHVQSGITVCHGWVMHTAPKEFCLICILHHCCILNHKLLPVLLLCTGYGCWISCHGSKCVCFFNLFSWQALLLASKMWRRFSIGAELTHNTQDANNGDTVKHSGHVVAGGWLSFCSLGVWQFLRSPNLS